MKSIYLCYDYVVSGDSPSLICGAHGAPCCHYCQHAVISVEFSATTTRRNVNVSFWEGKEHMTMVFAHGGGDVTVVKSNIALIACLLSLYCMDVTSINSADCS